MNTPRVLEKTVIELIGKINETNGENATLRLSEQRVWDELVACILGSRVTFETAHSAFKHLRDSGHLSLSNLSIGTFDWQKSVAKELRRPIFLPTKLDGFGRMYPFPYLRSKHIGKSWKMIYGKGTTLMDLLSGENGSREKRAKLLKSAWGIGPKQASLFLRNLCIAEDVAILDSHVLQYMLIHRLVKTPRKTVSSLRMYEHIEESLRRYADSLKTRLVELDVAIWITMRVFLRERNSWAL